MAALLIARFDGDIDQLTKAYDEGHALIMSAEGQLRSASCGITAESGMAPFS